MVDLLPIRAGRGLVERLGQGERREGCHSRRNCTFSVRCDRHAEWDFVFGACLSRKLRLTGPRLAVTSFPMEHTTYEAPLLRSEGSLTALTAGSFRSSKSDTLTATPQCSGGSIG